MTKSLASVVPMKLAVGSVPALPPNSQAVCPTALPTTALKLACETVPSGLAITNRSKAEPPAGVGMVVFATPPSPGNASVAPLRPMVTGPD
ncbi:MAG: hypothetical protein EBR51_10320 [Gammaproteobacteria bacterium]|nr:hypothetical protein [Gammaproteobacteria bacterium]